MRERLILALFLALSPRFAGAASLPAPDAANSLETLAPVISGVSCRGDTLVTVSPELPFAMVTPYHGASGSSEQRFGGLLDSKRIALRPGAGEEAAALPADPTRHWSGVAASADGFLILDGKNATLTELNGKPWRLGRSRDIALDVLRPPRDPGGEAPRFETERFRARFHAGWKKLKAKGALIFAGMTPVSPAFAGALGKGQAYYLLASRVPGYPLLLMRCAADEPSQCLIDRGCFVDGLKGVNPELIAGVGVYQRDVLLGVQGKAATANSAAVPSRVLRLAFHSCLAVGKTAEFSLPETLPRLGSLSVDEDGQLWVGTLGQEGRFNASVFTWALPVWRPR